MEIILILWHLLGKLFSIFLYAMPFGLFDSASYFIDIYSSPLFILLIWIISFIMGFIFLVYFIDLLNISVNPDVIQGTKQDGKKDKGPTFLTELLSFIFGKSNFGTFIPILTNFISQLRLKLIPILLILVVLYIPLTPTSKGYNTVGEYTFANWDFIGYSIFPSLYDKDEIEKKLKYAGLNTTDKQNNSLIYKDTDFLLQELSDSTIENTKLNYGTEQEVKLYENVYDKPTYDAYLISVDGQIALLQSSISSDEIKKDNAESKADISRYIDSIKKNKLELEKLILIRKDIESVYKGMSYTIDADGISKLADKMKSDKGFIEVKAYLVGTNTLIEENKIQTSVVEDDYNTIISQIDILAKNESLLEHSSLDTLLSGLGESNVKDVMSSIITYSVGNSISGDESIVKLHEVKSLIKNAQAGIIANKNYTDLLGKEKELLQSAKLLDDKIDNLTNIDTNSQARIDYIIAQNADILSSYPIGEDEDQRQALLLLQYKLLTLKTDFKDGDKTILLFGNRVEYVGIDLFKGFGLVLTIVTFIFTAVYYSLIVLMAGWKNMLLLYIATVSAIVSKIEKYISGKKKESIDTHLATIISNVFPDGADGDRELKWFNNNKHKKETYILIVIEFLLRFIFVYWLLIGLS